MLNIWQIYFDNNSLESCYPQWNHYDNSKKLTEHFENSVIVDLIDKGEHKKADYFGVFSHDVKKDMHFKEGDLKFNPENLETVISQNPNIDVFGFQKRRKQQNIIFQAENYHPGFKEIVNIILEETKFLPMIPNKLPNVILFNYFIARSEVYEKYVNEFLKPAMKVLEGLPQAYNDAKYKPTDEVTRARFKKAFGKEHYPYHPFILERLPSLWLTKYNYQFKSIF